MSTRFTRRQLAIVGTSALGASATAASSGGQPGARASRAFPAGFLWGTATAVAPSPTLYPWDLPQALQDRGGWETRDTAEAFADYAGYVAEKLSDRARHFFTLNECAAFVELGHGTGVFAPGLKLPPGRLNQVRHHALLAHGLAVQAIRPRSRPGTQTGPA